MQTAPVYYHKNMEYLRGTGRLRKGRQFMYCVRKINEDYTWIGADARRLPMFEGVFGVPNGISFNSYLLKDEKTVLFDTADHAVSRTFMENLAYALQGAALDYIVIQHMEPDHTAMLEDILIRHPHLQIYCSAMAKTMIGQFFGDAWNDCIHVVKEGDTLSTGRHQLTFVAAPMVHWPEVIMTYDTTDKMLMTADAFGCFGALNGKIFADEVDFMHEYLDETRRYYANIVGKYGPQVQAVLKKLATFDVQMLLPLHGFVWRKDLPAIIEKYDLWSRYEPEEKGVMIAYASVYGDTENAANILACRLAEKGIKVQMYDTSVTPASYIVSDAFRYSHLVFAATTYNAGVFITMEELLHDIAAHNLQNRRFMLIENGSWAPASGSGMKRIVEPLAGWELLEAPMTLKSALKADQVTRLAEMADTLSADLDKKPGEQKAETKRRFICKVCGYIYEGDELPADFKCPLCGAAAEYFKEVPAVDKKKYVCKVCGFVYEGVSLPTDFKCPICGRGSEFFEEKD